MNRLNPHPRPLIFVLAILSVLLVGATVASAAPTAGDPAGPLLTGAVTQGGRPGTIALTGEAFTPGGRVYVALYDVWGATLYETRWVTASDTVYGRNGSSDPAAGFGHGGMLREEFGHLCGVTPMVRAYDRASATWSNWLGIDAAGQFHYGPNGSADPALGFGPGC